MAVEKIGRTWLVGIGLLVALCLVVLVKLAAASQPDWFASVSPTVTLAKSDIGYSPTYPVDCNDEVLFEGDVLTATSFSTECVVDTSLGSITPDGNIIVDQRAKYRLTDQYRKGFILPVPNNGGYIQTNFASSWGGYISKYDSLSRANLLKVTYSGLPPRTEYHINVVPGKQLTDRAGARIHTSGSPLAFSPNGAWMIVDVPYEGLFRVNAAMNEMVPFAKSLEQTSRGQPYYAAISDDGNLVAMAGASALTIYRLAGCDQHQFTYGNPVSTQGCASREVWNDHGEVPGMGREIDASEISGHLQFADSDTLKLVARRRNINSGQYIYSSYYVSAPGAGLHKLALLGLGDSYISGEGIGVYQNGTDTTDNKCHLSPQSYPYLIGSQLFDSFKSIACSGAKMIDVNDDHLSYTGQTKSKVPLSEREPSKEDVLSAFSPGYAQQLWFVKEYHPKNVLLSIGGNDVRFADMVASCVVPEPANGTCYATYEERRQKAQQIHDSFGGLVSTYKNILKNGTEHLYVVGYPEVAREDGNCAVNVHLNNDEIRFSNLLIHYLNKTIEAAANTAGARYIDIEHALDDHRLCEASGDNIAMNGLTLGNDSGVYIPFIDWQLGPLEKSSYHPNALGHRLIKQTVLAASNNLQQLMPVADDSTVPPPVTDDMPLLAGYMASTNVPKLESIDDLTDGTLLRGTSTTIRIDGLRANTLPNSSYKVVLHSSPITLGTLVSDASGTISGRVTIPSDISPGMHTLNLYGSSFGGEPIQIQQFVYVAAAVDDADGDGIPNNQDPCVVVPGSGSDIDKDGIDDACDPVIADTPIGRPIESGAEGDSDADKNASIDETLKPLTVASALDSNSLQQSVTMLQVANNQTPLTSQAHVQGAATISDETESLDQVVPQQTKNTSHRKILFCIVAILLVAVLVARFARKSKTR